MEDDLPPLPMRIARYIKVRLMRVGKPPLLPINDEPFGSSAGSALPAIAEIQKTLAKPRRKGLGPKQLKWLRTNIEAFADMEKRAKQSRNGTIVQGKPGK